MAGGVSGFALSAIGYDSFAAAQTAEVQGGIYGINVISGIVYILVGLVMIFLYPLSKKNCNPEYRRIETSQRGDLKHEIIIQMVWSG